MRSYLDFEKPVAELESKIEELRKMSEADGLNIAEEVARLTEKVDRQLRRRHRLEKEKRNHPHPTDLGDLGKAA